jgi:8-oxo-dGTP pyrophosphatase MutT (NUDIX family)
MLKDRPQCGLILENAAGEILLQLRDDNASIPYPNCLGTFGGQIEQGEKPEQAIVREIREELEYDLEDFEYRGNYPFDGYDIYMFRKVDPDFNLNDVVVKEGQGVVFISGMDLIEDKYDFAFNC